MRLVAAILPVLLVVLSAQAQDKNAPEKMVTRFDVLPTPELYPQSDAKELLSSVVKVLEGNRIDYLLAHLTDPEYIDLRMRESGATFSELEMAARAKLKDDPNLLRQMKLIFKEGEVVEQEKSAVFSHKDLKDRKIYAVKIGQRWFIRNERVEEKKK